MNYFVLHSPSNLIVNLIASTYPPRDSEQYKFIKATDKVIVHYYKWLSNNPTLCPDIGEIIARSKYLQDSFSTGKAKAVSQNLNQRYREPSVVSVSYQDHAAEREQQVREFIVSHPEATALDVSDVFLCGMVVAKAYLLRYHT